MKKGCIYAIDHGTKRIGTAFSDSSRHFAFPDRVFEDEQDLFAYLRKRNTEAPIDRVVVGLPLNMDGTEGPRAEEVRMFCRRLEDAAGLSVVLWDERLSSVEAEELLKGCRKRGEEGKRQVDLVSAHVILRTYLASLQNTG